MEKEDQMRSIPTELAQKSTTMIPVHISQLLTLTQLEKEYDFRSVGISTGTLVKIMTPFFTPGSSLTIKMERDHFLGPIHTEKVNIIMNRSWSYAAISSIEILYDKEYDLQSVQWRSASVKITMIPSHFCELPPNEAERKAESIRWKKQTTLQYAPASQSELQLQEIEIRLEKISPSTGTEKYFLIANDVAFIAVIPSYEIALEFDRLVANDHVETGKKKVMAEDQKKKKATSIPGKTNSQTISYSNKEIQVPEGYNAAIVMEMQPAELCEPVSVKIFGGKTKVKQEIVEKKKKETKEPKSSFWPDLEKEGPVQKIEAESKT